VEDAKQLHRRDSLARPNEYDPIVRCAVAVSVLVGCGRIGFDPSGALDASPAGDAGGDAGLGPFGPFGAPVEQVALNSTVREFGPTLSADALELYVSSYRMPSTGGCDIWRATRPDRTAAFGAFTQMLTVSDVGDDGEPTLSNDGLTLYFQRYVPVRLLESTRGSTSSTAWSTPTTIAALAGYQGADFGPDDLRVVMMDTSTTELYEATRPDRLSPWGTPQLLANVGGMTGDGFPSLRGDGLEIFWESSRSQPQAIYHAVRPALDQPFGQATRVSLGALDTADVGDPDISADGHVLVVVSNATTGTGEYDVYTATR
jgi:Tol biopolymer transport system component